ncbi:MAG: hypothetical protein IJO23_07330 [Bacteroidales bacterium]|nr:hypothetical protein [Bacteroidales bacterium]
MANINQFNNEAGAVFKDESLTVNVQPVINSAAPSEVDIQDDTTPGLIAISDDGAQVDLLRIAVAAYRTGLFKRRDGRKLNQIDVIRAFTKMVGIEIKNPYNDLRDEKVLDSTASTEIFDSMKRAFIEYEDEKLERSKK